MNKENLKKLADWIEINLTEDQFDMKAYRQDDQGTRVGFHSINNCGTVGCLLGWAPFVPGLEVIGDELIETHPKLFSGNHVLCFESYSQRVFNLNSLQCEWDYLFEGRWARYQPTLKEAVQRVRTIIEDDSVSRKDFPWCVPSTWRR